jgi:type I protein arginine methyltransferase
MLLSHLNGYCPLTRCLSAASPPAADGSSTAGAATSLEEHDCIYFQSYSHIGIHEAMIKVTHLADSIHPLNRSPIQVLKTLRVPPNRAWVPCFE